MFAKNVKVKTKEQKTVFTNDDKKKIIQPFFEALPKKKNRILCIILCENGSNYWLWKSKSKDTFSFRNNLYFILETYVSDNNVRFAVYMEGISTPMSHKNITKQTVQKEIVDPVTNKVKTMLITTIKGLKFDSKILDMLLNRGLFRELTRQYLDIPNIIVIVLLMVAVGLAVANLTVGIAL